MLSSRRARATRTRDVGAPSPWFVVSYACVCRGAKIALTTCLGRVFPFLVAVLLLAGDTEEVEEEEGVEDQLDV